MADMLTSDEKWMRRALALARRGEGLTRPNPPVGAVLVKRGKMIGEGFHRIAGGPHAEIVALLDAGKAAYGATLYVTLEPCSTWGRTPPCTDAILDAGIARVVVGATDPNPKHAGRGLALLRRKGVEVVAGVCRAEAEELIAPFARHQLTGRPFVTLKLAQTLDGRIADASGASRWITSPAARERVQALRRRVDVIMVGGETVRADNPSLMPRPSADRCPLRLIITASGDLPPRAKVLRDPVAACTLIATTPAGARRLARMKTQARIWAPPTRGRQVDLAVLLHKLGERGCLHALCEGGGQLAAGLLRAKLVDELQLFIAPKILGGAARPAIGDGWKLAEAPGFTVSEVERIGTDLLIRARVTEGR